MHIDAVCCIWWHCCGLTTWRHTWRSLRGLALKCRRWNSVFSTVQPIITELARCYWNFGKASNVLENWHGIWVNKHHWSSNTNIITKLLSFALSAIFLRSRDFISCDIRKLLQEFKFSGPFTESYLILKEFSLILRVLTDFWNPIGNILSEFQWEYAPWMQNLPVHVYMWPANGIKVELSQHQSAAFQIKTVSKTHIS